MGKNTQQAVKTLWDGSLAVGNIHETELADGQGKDIKTFILLAASGNGTVTLQFSLDRITWYNHPSSENPADFVAGTPVTITVSDVLPVMRLRIQVTGGGTGNVKAWYVA